MARPPLEAQVVVIGAGAAGLAAAAELARAARRVLVVEARDRVGGRCDTRRLPGIAAPVELGAEFIHGRPEATTALLARAGVPAVDSMQTQLMAWRGGLRRVDAFAEARRAARGRIGGSDLSFRAFLARQRLSGISRALVRMWVEGFDAADPDAVSARDIAEEWRGLSPGQRRPLGGYGPLVESMLQEDFRVRLGAVVREVRWRRGLVEVAGEGFRARARSAIITLPLGVLQSGAVSFEPELREKHVSLEKLASGPVIRVALAFREAFWETRHPGVAFFHSPRSPFPTFWTPLPLHARLLTAWAGGPKAARLTGLSRRKLLEEALASVRAIFGRIPSPQAACVQDWQADPFARGGYSYVRVGGQGAREILKKPLEQTLFFAGEATASEDSGTVGGALQSGIRAAREIMRRPARRGGARAPRGGACAGGSTSA